MANLSLFSSIPYYFLSIPGVILNIDLRVTPPNLHPPKSKFQTSEVFKDPALYFR